MLSYFLSCANLIPIVNVWLLMLGSQSIGIQFVSQRLTSNRFLDLIAFENPLIQVSGTINKRELCLVHLGSGNELDKMYKHGLRLALTNVL